MESYCEDKKNLYALIHEFLDESEESNDDEVSKNTFEKLIDLIRNQQIVGDGSEMRQFLEIIKRIGEHHHRDQYFNERLNQLLLHYLFYIIIELTRKIESTI